MRKLFVLTHVYPYAPPIEQFLHAEMPYLLNKLDKICIIPTSHSSYTKERRCLDFKNLNVCRIKRVNKFVECFCGLLACVFKSSDFYKEVWYLLANKKVNIYNFRWLLLYYINSYIIYTRAYKLIKNEISSDDSLIIYSYWFNEFVYAAIKIKEKLNCDGYKKIKIISRAHGAYDIFRPINGYRPGLNICIDRIYSISQAGRDYLIETGFPGEIVNVSRLGVKDFEQSHKTKNNGAFTIVSCSRVIELKRVGLIVGALSKIHGINIEWFHFGDGPLLEEVQSSSKSLKSNIRCHFLGNVENDFILESYDRLKPDLFINVSTIEGIPVSIMEAIMFGIPVIATDVGGSKEICIDGYNGILLPKNILADDLAEAIMLIVKDEELKLKYGKNSRELYDSCFNSDKNYNKFTEEIDTLFG